jgi:hypothetical protein
MKMKLSWLTTSIVAILAATAAQAQFVDERGGATSVNRFQPGAPQGGANSGWRIKYSDVRLADAFTRWGRQAGWQVRWDAPKHVLIEGEDNFGGNFDEAVTQALSTPGLRNSPQPLEVCFYPNTPPLARITVAGEQTKECK